MQRIQDNGILLHYEMENASTHVMSAKVEAESSLCFVKAVNYVSKVFGVMNELKTGSLSKGSVVKIFWFEVDMGEGSEIINFIVTKVFAKLFFEKVKISFEDLVVGLEDGEKESVENKLKQLDIDENILERLNSHVHIKKARSEYFKQLKSYKSINAVGVKFNNFGNLDDADIRIKSCTFDNYIEDYIPETIIKDNAKVYIISPVLLRDRKIKWKGNYDEKDITFEMLSNQFKTEAQNGEVDFRTGYYINCRLQYEETFDEDEEPIHNNYKVLEVYGHGFDNQYIETTSGKKKRIEDNLPTLFDGLDDW